MNEQLSVEIKVQKLLQILKFVGIAVAVAGVIYGAISWQQNKKEEMAVHAFESLFEVEKIEQKALKEAQITASNPLEVFKTWPDSQKREYLESLSKIQTKYPDSAASALAGIKIGRWHFEEKKYSEAIQAYEVVYKSSAAKTFPLYAALSAEGIGSSYESQQKYEDALKQFENSLRLPKNPLKPLAYLGKARNLKALGRVDDAKKTYETLIAEFPASPYEKKARVLMETLSL